MTQKSKSCKNIGIITLPLVKAGYTPVTNIITAISNFSDPLYVITSDEIKENFSNNEKVKFMCFDSNIVNSLSGFLKMFYIQIFALLSVLRINRKVDIWVFFLDSHTLLLPVISAKLINRSLVYALASSNGNTIKAKRRALLQLILYSEAIALRLADRILVYSSNLISDWNLEKYATIIKTYNEHFLDFSRFFKETEFSDRKNIVAYVGRLSEEKGTLNFVDSIPCILSSSNDDISFFIGGDGPLNELIQNRIRSLNLNDKVQLYGWIDHNKLPGFLNQFKLVVLPSYSEGLPNIVLESMACGTPVLANRVGAIPGIIQDGENGFIMENNSKNCIAENVVRALNDEKIINISDTCVDYVRNEFTLFKTIGKLKQALDDL